MIRTFITPTQSRQKFTLNVPDEYIGQELEVIVFKRLEGLDKTEEKITMSDLWNSLSDETAKKLHENVTTLRAEWGKDI
jgi:hypothetical protein